MNSTHRATKEQMPEDEDLSSFRSKKKSRLSNETAMKNAFNLHGSPEEVQEQARTKIEAWVAGDPLKEPFAEGFREKLDRLVQATKEPYPEGGHIFEQFARKANQFADDMMDRYRQLTETSGDSLHDFSICFGTIQSESYSHRMVPQVSVGTNPVHPHDNDVVCGRGIDIMNHPGNVRYGRLIKDQSSRYLEMTSNKEKESLTRSIVEQVRSLNPPGRFLSKDQRMGTWSDVGDKVAMKKTAQALRDDQRNLSRENGARRVSLGSSDKLKETPVHGLERDLPTLPLVTAHPSDTNLQDHAFSNQMSGDLLDFPLCSWELSSTAGELPEDGHLKPRATGSHQPNHGFVSESTQIPDSSNADSTTRAKQQRLLLLWHASKCQKATGECPLTHCATAKQIREHIRHCPNPECEVQYCLSSQSILSHHWGCKDSRCAVCRQVRIAIQQSTEHEKIHRSFPSSGHITLLSTSTDEPLENTGYLMPRATDSRRLGRGFVSESTQVANSSSSSNPFDQSSIGDTMATCSVTDNDVLLKIYGKGTLTTRMYRNEVRPQFGRKMPSQQDVERIKESTHQCVREGATRDPRLDPDKRPVFLVPAEGEDFASGSLTLYTWRRGDHRVDWFKEASFEEIQLDIYNNASPRKHTHTERRDHLADVIEEHKIKLARERRSRGHDPAFSSVAREFQNDLIQFEQAFCVGGEQSDIRIERDKGLIATIRKSWKALKGLTTNDNADVALI